VQPLARITPDSGTGQPGYAFHRLTFTAERTKALAAVEKGTVNDVLLAALHLAVAGWNDEHGTSSRRIGVMVPVNLRPKEWWEEMAGNFSLMVRVPTAPDDRTSPETVLDAVAGQSNRIKKGGTGAALIEALGGLDSEPLWAKQPVAALLSFTGKRIVDSVLLSNLGRLDDAPSFGPDAGDTTGLWFWAPARMPLGLSIGTVTVGGRLHLAFRYRHPLFDAGAARRFAERYAAALDRFTAAAGR
jgi:NRPS condensation-like uncharacterized protein